MKRERATQISAQDLSVLRSSLEHLTAAQQAEVGLTTTVKKAAKQDQGKLKPSKLHDVIAKISAAHPHLLAADRRSSGPANRPEFTGMADTLDTYSLLLKHTSNVKHAQIIQISGSWIRPVIHEILKNEGHTVDLYIQDPRVTCPERIRIRVIEFLMNFADDLEIHREGSTSRLNIYLYESNLQGRRICLFDRNVVALSDFKIVVPIPVAGHPFRKGDAAESTLAHEPYKLYKHGTSDQVAWDAGLRAALEAIAEIREHCGVREGAVEPAIVAEGRRISYFDPNLVLWLQKIMKCFDDGFLLDNKIKGSGPTIRATSMKP